MKKLKSFLRSLRVKPIYDGFSGKEEVFAQFEKPLDEDIQIVYAFYDTPLYEGYATVIYYRKSTKKYYEAYGSHCSCFGLEGQWDGDEEIVAEELVKRIDALNALYVEYLKK